MIHGVDYGILGFKDTESWYMYQILIIWQQKPKFEIYFNTHFRLAITKEGDKKIPLYSIHSNPANSYEFCVGGRDHYIR